MSWGLGRNVTLPTISKYAKVGINDEKTERDLAKKLLEEVDTKAVDISSLQARCPEETSRR